MVAINDTEVASGAEVGAVPPASLGGSDFASGMELVQEVAAGTVRIRNMAGGHQDSTVDSAVYVAAPDVVEYFNHNATGITVTLDVSALSTAASVLVTVLGVDRTSGKTWKIGATAAVTTVTTVTIAIHPNNPTAALSNGLQTQQGQLPPVVRIAVTQGNTNETTYSVGANFTK